MLAVVITGSRDWADRAAVEAALIGADVLIVGDCPDSRSEREILEGKPMRSADAIALQIAREWHIIPRVLRADWQAAKRRGHVKAAGPIRNRAIVQEAVYARDREEIVVRCHAFPIDDNPRRGTWDCVRQLRAAGFAACVRVAA